MTNITLGELEKLLRLMMQLIETIDQEHETEIKQLNKRLEKLENLLKDRFP